MDIKVTYVQLRKEILKILSGVENSKSYLWWDNTTPNHMTKNRLEKLYNESLKNFEKYGFYIVNRHLDCGNKIHYEVNNDDYVMDKIGNASIEYNDERFIWKAPIFQDKMLLKCPCSDKNRKTEHHVIQDILYEKSHDINICEQISLVINDIHSAIECAEDRRPRSAIREYLLRSILLLNDFILPKPVQEYIDEI